MHFKVKVGIPLLLLLLCSCSVYVWYSMNLNKFIFATDVFHQVECQKTSKETEPKILSARKPFPYTEWAVENSVTPPPPRFCVIARTMEVHQLRLYAFMMSLLANRPPRLNVFLVNTVESPFPSLPDMIEHANIISNSQIFHDVTNMFNVSSSRARFGDVDFDKYGYIITDMVLEYILQQQDENHANLCEYVLVTNGDNLYGNGFFQAAWEKIREGFNVIGVHFISHHNWPPPTPEQVCGPRRGGTDLEIHSALKRNCMDLGGAMFSRSLIGDIRFIITEIHRAKVDFSRLHGADGYFFERITQQNGAKGVIIPRVLMLHQ